MLTKAVKRTLLKWISKIQFIMGSNKEKKFFMCVSRGQKTLGIDRPEELSKEDDEYEAYRKRMMLAYRFRPNPLVSTRVCGWVEWIETDDGQIP